MGRNDPRVDVQGQIEGAAGQRQGSGVNLSRGRCSGDAYLGLQQLQKKGAQDESR